MAVLHPGCGAAGGAAGAEAADHCGELRCGAGSSVGYGLFQVPGDAAASAGALELWVAQPVPASCHSRDQCSWCSLITLLTLF